MFEVKFFVTEKDLGEAFKRLTGLARDVSYHYVPNLEPKANGKVHMSAADSQEMFLKEMHKRKLTQVNANVARDICKEIGFAQTSYSYMLQGLQKTGVLKRSGTPQKYVYTLKGNT
jgi:hypothetical protein